jgi:hypothetical protein
MATDPIRGTGDGTSTSLNFTKQFFAEQLTPTTIRLVPNPDGMTDTPDYYRWTWQKLLSTYVPDGTSDTGTFEDDSVIIDNLVAGAKYLFKLQAYKGTARGESMSMIIDLSSTSFNGQIVKSNSSPQIVKPSKSYLKISNSSKNKNESAIALKSFGIALPVSTQVTPSGKTYKITSYSKMHYAFGTKMFMMPTQEFPNPGGGLGFFVGGEGTSGYFIFVETTAAAAAKDRKSVRISKSDGTNLKELVTSQVSATSTLDGIYAGVTYTIDVKVKIQQQKVTIDAYINGFRITATDTENYAASNKIPTPTNNIGLVSVKGQIAYDYVFGTSITEEEYNKKDYMPNFYDGQFSNDVLSTTFGNLLYDANADQDQYTSDSAKKATILDEFGTVVREIAYVKTRYGSGPAYPVKWSTGNNSAAKIIASKASSFGGEAYVLNNSSSTIPLSDGSEASFYLIGNTIGESGTLEYSTDEDKDNDYYYGVVEPIGFESTWLQNENDVKKLANWIKEKVVNRGKIVELTTFGNPLICIGDIVSINYAYQGFNGTQLLIVTNITNSFSEGLETTVTCRTL